jgi:DNA-binding transcriptional ArsR family regulator
MREALLPEPLRGWDSTEIGKHTGLSKTGIHHQMAKLKDCGLVSTKVEGKWHRHILRGGSMSAAAGLVKSEATAVLKMRLKAASQLIEHSETRMVTEVEEDPISFHIRISELGPSGDGFDSITALVSDFGLAGGSPRSGGKLAREVLEELSANHHPTTILALSEKLSESRGRVGTIVDRMRSAGFVERVPMVSRLPQDIFSGLVRQLDARGEGWLMTRGGLGRLEESVSSAMIAAAGKGELTIEAVTGILSPVPIQDQRVLLNTLGGRMPYGVRVTGSDGNAVSQRVSRQADRALRRILTVSERLDESLSE